VSRFTFHYKPNTVFRVTSLGEFSPIR
jgi:hypothetical protein